MGLILPQKIKMKLSSTYIKHLESKGYDLPKRTQNRSDLVKQRNRNWSYALGEYIEIDVLDLKPNSNKHVLCECDLCHEIIRTPYQTYNKRKGKEYYCNSCAVKIYNSGENSNLWNPELSEEDRLNMHRRNLDPRVHELNKKVMKRDNYTCIVCGQKATDVHHLNSWNKYPEERFDVTNCVSLCSTCHRSFHHSYFFGNNTREQFEIWLGYAIETLQFEGELETQKQFYCIEDDCIYSVTDFMIKYNIKRNSNIYTVLNSKEMINKKNNNKYTPKSVCGKHLIPLDKYNTMDKKDIEQYLFESYWDTHSRSNRIICITTGVDFISSKAACNLYNEHQLSLSPIGRCCKGKQKTAGKLPDGTPLKWMYYSEFTTLPPEKQLEIIEENLQTLEEGSFLMQKYEELTKEKAS